METSNLPDAEFKTLVIRMLNELSENHYSIENAQSEMKYTLTELKSNLQGINSRINKAENQISKLEYMEAKNTQSEQQKEKWIKKYEDNIMSLWDNFKHTNVLIMGMPKGEEGARNWKPIWKNNDRKLPWPGAGNRHISPGTTESPKQDELKEAHTKTHHK